MNARNAKTNAEHKFSATFLSFTETAERVAATTKRLEKASFLKDYFETLPDEDLIMAARFFAGQAFSLADQRTTNIGGAMLFNAISAAIGVEVEELRRLTVISGDLGETAAKVFQAETPANYTLRQIADFIEQIAETSGTKLKTSLLVDFLKPANNLEAKYIVKILSGDLRIGLQEGAVEDAIAKAFGATVASVQWTNMLTGDIGETAFLFRHGKAEEAKMRFFHPIKFMLASPSDLDDVAKRMPDAFAVEDKFDGIRGQAHIGDKSVPSALADGFAVKEEPSANADGTDLSKEKTPAAADDTDSSQIRVALFSRTLDEITKSFPELVEPLSQLIENQPGGIILDGEILPIKDGRILPFQDLQKRLGRKTVSAEMLQQTPVAFIAYDCLFGDGRILINEPFAERRKILESLNFDNQFGRLAESKIFTEVAKLDEEFDSARERGNEGLMVKNLSSPYKPGKRGRDWLKIKRALATLDVVVTSVEVGNGRRSRFLSDYTFAVRASEEDATLLNVGKAYSGLTDAEIEELSEWFKAHTIQQFAHGKVRTVEPLIVLEVTFDRVQPSPRHKSGYALRFPRILRIRDDKPVAEIDTLETVKRLSEG